MEANSADCASLMMIQKLFPSKPHYASRLPWPTRANTPSAESEVEYMSLDIDFEAPMSSQLEPAPDKDEDTGSLVVPAETPPQDDHETTIVTDSFPVIQDTIVDPSPGTEADNNGENSENVTIIESLRNEMREMRIQMENVQKDYASVVSSKDKASAKIHQLNQDIVKANLRLEKRDQDLKAMDIQYKNAQARIESLENTLKATLEKQSFASSLLEPLVRTLQTMMQQLDSSINNSTQQLDASIRDSTQTLTTLLTALQPPPPAPPAPEPPSYQAGGVEEFRKMFKEFAAAPFAFRGCPFPFSVPSLTL